MTFLRFWASSLPESAGKCIASSRGPTGSGIRNATRHVLIFFAFLLSFQGVIFGALFEPGLPGPSKEHQGNPFSDWAASGEKASRNVGDGSRILSGRQILGFSPCRRAPRPGDRLSESSEQPRNQDSEKKSAAGLAGAGRSRRFRGGKKWNFGTFWDSLGRGRKYSFPPKGAATETPRALR